MPGSIHVPVTVATQGFTKLQRQFSRLRGITIGLTAAIASLGITAKAVDFAGAAVQGARDLERNYAGLASVFKDNTDQMIEFGKASDSLGLSMSEAAKATTFIGAVLKQSGFEIQETSDLTEELVALGADLALTFGYDIQESLLAMTALFRGEYDPIEKFGVAMKQSEIDSEKMARGLDKLVGAEERFADQQIRVELLMDRASDAMGAVERQSENLAVQQMRLRAEFANLRDTVGMGLLPAFAEMTGGLREIVDDVGPDLEDIFDRLGPLIASVSDDGLDVLSAGIEGALEFASELIGFFEEALDPTSELNIALGNAATEIGELASNIAEHLPTMQESFDNLAVAVTITADALAFFADTADRVVGPVLDLTGSDSGVGVLALAAAFALLDKRTRGLFGRLAKFPVKNPYTLGLLALSFGVAGLDRELEKAKPELDKFEASMSKVPDSVLQAADASELATIRVLAQLDAQGKLNDAINDPDVAFLAQKYGFIESLFGDVTVAIDGTTASLPPLKMAFESTSPAAQLMADKLAMANLELFKFKEATLQILQLELRDLFRFGADPKDIAAVRDQIKVLTKKIIDPDEEDDDLGGEVAKDFVGDFFAGLREEMAKQSARLKLQDLGFSEALIDQIVGSQGFEEVFEAIIAGGKKMAESLQANFNRTSAGIKELADIAKEAADKTAELAEQVADLNDELDALSLERADAIADATEQFDNFKDSIDVTVDALQTYEREIGKFEQATRTDLQRIESQIQMAFDNGFLLEGAKNNLLDYARAELGVLLQIQKQRDDLLLKRNAAADVIFGIAKAVAATGNITGLLSDVQDKITEVEVTEVFEDIVKTAGSLEGFKVTLTRNFIDVVSETVDKSRALVGGFETVIARTRMFIDNLKALRELGLDPFLFQQLVDAGAEAGGATAQALVEGGADTVNEVNSLQRELESLGVELGDMTYEVTKNSGQQFVSGIVDGMDDELGRLQVAANNIATNFAQTFALAMTESMNTAFESIIDEIKSDFQKMMDELLALLEELRKKMNEGTGVLSYDREGMPQLSLTPSPPPASMPGAFMPQPTPSPGFGGSPVGFPGASFMPTVGTFGGMQTNNITVNASGRAEGAQAGEMVVQALKSWNSSNGNYEVSLTGFGA